MPSSSILCCTIRFPCWCSQVQSFTHDVLDIVKLPLCCWFWFRVMLIHLEQVYFQTNLFEGMRENFRILLIFFIYPVSINLSYASHFQPFLVLQKCPTNITVAGHVRWKVKLSPCSISLTIKPQWSKEVCGYSPKHIPLQHLGENSRDPFCRRLHGPQGLVGRFGEMQGTQ